MQPVRRLEAVLHIPGQRGYDAAHRHDGEEGRPVALLMLFQRNVADRAAIAHRQQAVEQFTLAAGRAALEQRRFPYRRHISPKACSTLFTKLPYTQTNRNSHTTSTKCQYQAANSNPR